MIFSLPGTRDGTRWASSHVRSSVHDQCCCVPARAEVAVAWRETFVGIVLLLCGIGGGIAAPIGADTTP